MNVRVGRKHVSRISGYAIRWLARLGSRLVLISLVVCPLAMIYILALKNGEPVSGPTSLSQSGETELVVQIHEEATSASLQAVADFINHSGFGPAVIQSNGCARWTRTRTFSSLEQLSEALVRVRENYPLARAVDPHMSVHETGAIVCSMANGLNALDTDGAQRDQAYERRDRIRILLEAFYRKERRSDPEAPGFDWSSQTYWDEQNLRLTIVAPLNSLTAFPLYDDVDYDTFIQDRSHWAA